MDLVILILVLCGVKVCKALAICAIIEGVLLLLAAILKVLEKKGVI